MDFFSLLNQYWEFPAGLFSGLGGMYLVDRVTLPNKLKVTVSRIDFGYDPIDLNEWDTLLSRDQVQDLAQRILPKDSIELSDRFVREFNGISAE